MFVPIILGSDKTTVSVATGQHDYHPIYISNGNVHNNVRRAHKGAVSLLGFLPVPKGLYRVSYIISSLKISCKGSHKDNKSKEYRIFRRKLFHSAIAKMFESLRPAMSKPEVIKCADGNYRKAVFGFGPYIADYPEQTIIASVVQGWCPM
jgi:hypothetical protein